MKLTVLFLIISVGWAFGSKTYSQTKTLSLRMENATIKEVLAEIENQSEFRTMYSGKFIDVERRVSIHIDNQKIDATLKKLFAGTDVSYTIRDRFIVLLTPELREEEIMAVFQQRAVSGRVTDAAGGAIPGVTVTVKGLSKGTVTNRDGDYSLTDITDGTTLVFTSVGMLTKEVAVGSQSTVNVTMEEEAIGIEEVIAVGYGSMRKRDLTGSAIQADIDKFRDQPNVSIVQSLRGSVAGLNVGQITQAGEEPSISVRGRTSISGEQQPLIVLDGVIFRGNLIDINPDDIETLDILRDNSAAAVYGSQAANGVILITSKSGKGKNMKPLINYTASYAFQSPAFELKPGNGEDFVKKNSDIDWLESRTRESGYVEPKADYAVSNTFKTNEELENYLAGRESNWYDLLTNDRMYVQNHNLSLANRTDHLNYFISAGLTNQRGYMINEAYKRYNARINVDNKVADWLTIGIQSFVAISDNSGESPSPADRYIMPYETAYKENGELNPLIEGRSVSPLVVATADDLDIRNNYFGNIYASVNVPYVKGLSYKANFSNNYRTTRNYHFQPYASNFQGEAQKSYSDLHDMSSDHIVTYKRRFDDAHNLDMTLLYGFEKRKYDYTDAASSVFINDILGYHNLQAGSSELQSTYSGAWEEKSLYSMARLFYSLHDKYMLTATVRRDGFSGFSEKNKFGVFPSFALGWVASEEPFFRGGDNVVDYLKFRFSYGTIGNRTVGRYQTLARVDGDFRYVNASGMPVYAKSISSLASSDLKWEATTGFNVGVDFGIFHSRLTGQLEYYNNDTKDLLYSVDIPSIGRFQKFPANLGRIHNQGIEITLASTNIDKENFRWKSDFSFSRNRDKLKELLGFDNDGDGKEDDLISEGLFIGHPLNVAFHYQVTGALYQLGDDIPSTSDVGAQIIVDQNNDGRIDPDNDKIILGYTEPSYRFSVTNQFTYKNWSLNVFINAVQGGKDYFYAMDNIHYQTLGAGFSNSEGSTQHYQLNFPKGLDYWLPENPDARYPRVGTAISSNLLATTWTQRSFVRLQDVALGYNINPGVLDKLKVNKLRVFISGQNLYTWTKWPGWDPETGEGISRRGRPVLQSYTLGLNLEF